jgi:hypothetical protein
MIRPDKLSYTVGRIESSYGIVTETEEYCVSILTRVSVTDDGSSFTFDASQVHSLVFARRMIIAPRANLPTAAVCVKIADVREKLRGKSEQHHLSLWIDAMRSLKRKVIFEDGRKPWAPAITSVRSYLKPKDRRKVKANPH